MVTSTKMSQAIVALVSVLSACYSCWLDDSVICGLVKTVELTLKTYQLMWTGMHQTLIRISTCYMMNDIHDCECVCKRRCHLSLNWCLVCSSECLLSMADNDRKLRGTHLHPSTSTSSRTHPRNQTLSKQPSALPRCFHLPWLEYQYTFTTYLLVWLFDSSLSSIMRLMTVWGITGKIIRTTVFDTYCKKYNQQFLQF